MKCIPNVSSCCACSLVQCLINVFSLLDFNPDTAPARAAFQAAALPKGAKVEIEAIAFIPPKP